MSFKIRAKISIFWECRRQKAEYRIEVKGEVTIEVKEGVKGEVTIEVKEGVKTASSSPSHCEERSNQRGWPKAGGVWKI